jgi:nucleoside-diphosphate-sugar epimerase
VEIAWCNLLHPNEVEQAVRGCDVIVHCAYGASGAYSNERRLVTVDGTRNLLASAVRQGVKRVIHISTIAVYSYSPPDDVSEAVPLIRSGDDYCDDKIDAEKVVWKYIKYNKLQAVVLRMGNIYGPFSGPWTVRPLRHIQEGWITLVDGGVSSSNMIFIDNAVEAILLSILHDSGIGQAFFITDDPVSWASFYGRYADWQGGALLRSMHRDEFNALLHRPPLEKLKKIGGEIWNQVIVPSVRYSAFRIAGSPPLSHLAATLWRAVPSGWRKPILGDLSGKSIPPAIPSAHSDETMPPLGLLQVYAARTTFRNDKAKQLLGYGPLIGLDDAMRITRQWAEWARLIPAVDKICRS